MTWQDAWREGRTHWDAGKSPPTLHELVAGGDLPTGLTIVPGCGSGYDVFTLASDERPVIGIDVAPLAGERFETLRGQRGISADHARIVIGDVFTFDPGEPVRLWWDYTFFCALDPDQRPAWGKQVDALLAEDAELVTLMFPTGDFGPMPGPPFTVSVELYQRALGPGWKPTRVSEITETHAGREGLEQLARWKRV